MRIEVTQEDYVIGTRPESDALTQCVVANALRRALPAADISVGIKFARINTQQYDLGPRVAAFINDCFTGGMPPPVFPFTFDLPLADEEPSSC